jgi:hypothetical protein
MPLFLHQMAMSASADSITESTYLALSLPEQLMTTSLPHLELLSVGLTLM